MKQKIFFIPILALGLLVLSGCAKQSTIIGQITGQMVKNLEEARIENRDAKRLTDVKLIDTIIQIYILNTERMPTIKDSNGNFRSFKLIKDSSDFITLESAIKENVPSGDIPVDLSDPIRYYEFYSDGQNYIIKAYLEQDNGNCKQTKPGYCEFEIKGNMDAVLN